VVPERTAEAAVALWERLPSPNGKKALAASMDMWVGFAAGTSTVNGA
jgi:hypothetical protein